MIITKTVDGFHNELKRENDRLNLVNFRHGEKVRKPFQSFKQSFCFNQRWAMLKTRPRTNYKSYRPKRENESVILASLLRKSQDLDKEGMGP